MNTKSLFGITFGLFSSLIFAQNTIIYSKNNQISDQLDLRAVASIFGESQNLEDFEYRLNDPNLQISNLDLNRDNQVDYLRVVENTQDNNKVILIQAVLDQDVFQDVATIDLERRNDNNIKVQIIGNPYFYSSNNIVVPVYNRPPLLFNIFWRPNYYNYCSKYRWNYYPKHYYTWRPVHVSYYPKKVKNCISHYNTYNYYPNRYNQTTIVLSKKYSSNDYAKRYYEPQRRYEDGGRRNYEKDYYKQPYKKEDNRRNNNDYYYQNTSNTREKQPYKEENRYNNGSSNTQNRDNNNQNNGRRNYGNSQI